jgi:general secretion pathway protein M
MMNELKDRWNALPARTRQLAASGVALIAIMLLYSTIWSPMQKSLTRLRVEMPRAAEQLNWMRTQAPTIKAMRAKMTSSTGPLLPSIEQSATALGVRSHATKIEAEGGSGARVVLEQVPFNALLTWLSHLQSSQGLSIEEASIEAHTASGLVNARLRLRAGGS